MNSKEVSIPAEVESSPPEDQASRIHARLYSAARAAWWPITLFVLGLNIASVPILYRNLGTICTQGACEYKLTVDQAQQMHNLGLSITFFTVLLTAIFSLVPFFYIFVAYLLFRRKSAGWIGLLGAFTLVLFGGITFPETPTVMGMTYPALQPPIAILNFLGSVTFPLFLIVFPDGRVRPRWTIALVAAWAVLLFPAYVFPMSAFDLGTWPNWIQQPIWVGMFGSLILVQTYRYRRIYGPVLRQQTKWVVYGLIVGLGGFTIMRAVYLLLPVEIQDNVLVLISTNLAAYLLMALIPISIAFAIFRYRLWDIDLLINRTLVYVPLTAILGGLYSATVALFQKIFVATTGVKSDAALILTTFVVVATFTPVKNGLQMAVDKRFKETVDPLKEINALDRQVRSVVEVLDPGLITRRLLETAVRAFQAFGGAIYLERAGQMVLAQGTPGWDEGDAAISLPLEWNGRRLGLLTLGGRAGGLEYSQNERQALQQAANRVARAVAGFGADPGE